jgi:hypothetical protein
VRTVRLKGAKEITVQIALPFNASSLDTPRIETIRTMVPTPRIAIAARASVGA